MQLNIFAKALPLLKEKHSDIEQQSFINFLGRYKPNNWIYPAVIHRELGIDLRRVYEILEDLRSAGFVTQYLEVYCPYCHRFSGQYFERLTDIPEYVNCIHCDEEIDNPYQHAIVIYKVCAHGE